MEMAVESRKEKGVRKFMPEEYFEFKSRIHNRLLDLMDLSLIETLDRRILKAELRGLLERILNENGYDLPDRTGKAGYRDPG